LGNSSEPALVKITIAKGRTFKVADYESLRLDYSVEDNVPRERAIDTIRMWESNINKLLAEHEPSTPAEGTTKAPETKAAPATQPFAPTTTTPPQAPGATNPYRSLPWKQSEKKPVLWTIKVTEKLLTDPLARQLYEQVKPVGDKGIGIGEHTYKLSVTEKDTPFYLKGTEFLQRWPKK
jgi:hypothetical protein